MKPFVLLAVLAALLLPAVAHSGTAAATCSIVPSSVAVGEQYAVTASGLPNNNVYLIITAPDGAMLTTRIDTPHGEFSADGIGGFWNGLSGTYTYQFVSKVEWPLGSYKTLYATCEVQVSQ